MDQGLRSRGRLPAHEQRILVDPQLDVLQLIGDVAVRRIEVGHHSKVVEGAVSERVRVQQGLPSTLRIGRGTAQHGCDGHARGAHGLLGPRPLPLNDIPSLERKHDARQCREHDRQQRECDNQLDDGEPCR